MGTSIQSDSSDSLDRVILIDGKNFVYRHHYTHRQLSSNGNPTSVLYGCPAAMLSLAHRFPGAALVFIWDGEGVTWRHKLLTRGKSDFHSTLGESAKITKVKGTLPPYMQMSVDFIQGTRGVYVAQATRSGVSKGSSSTLDRPTKKEKKIGYKANRGDQPDFADAMKQIPIFKDFLDRLGFRQFEIDNLEGDDLMGIMATWIEKYEIFDEVIIHSSDRDFYQFISDKVRVLRSIKEGGFAKRSDIELEFGVSPDNYTRLRAIIGDSGDNIPHLFKGVGPKTAAKWINVGLDPSVERWQALPSKVREGLADVNVKYKLRERWNDIHTNYIVSEIVRSPENEHLDLKVSKDLVNLFKKVSKGYLLSDRRKRTEEKWRWLTDYLTGYDMIELLGRRQELWELP